MIYAQSPTNTSLDFSSQCQIDQIKIQNLYVTLSSSLSENIVNTMMHQGSCQLQN